MKKLICLILVLALAVSFAACGGSGAAAGSNNNSQGEQNNSVNNEEKEEGYVFHHNGTAVVMNADAAPILAALGEPNSYTEEASCAFSGLDKTYFYGNFYLQTYPQGDKDYVYGVWFADDSVSTDEGVYVGMAKADVEKAYGADAFNGSNAYVLTKGKTTLTIIIKDDVVSSIQYDAVVE